MNILFHSSRVPVVGGYGGGVGKVIILSNPTHVEVRLTCGLGLTIISTLYTTLRNSLEIQT